MGKKEIDKVVEAVDRCVVRQSGAIIGRMGQADGEESGTVRERGLKIGRKRSDTIIQRMSQTRRKGRDNYAGGVDRKMWCGGSGAGGWGWGCRAYSRGHWPASPRGGGGVRTGTSRREHVASKSERTLYDATDPEGYIRHLQTGNMADRAGNRAVGEQRRYMKKGRYRTGDALGIAAYGAAGSRRPPFAVQ